MKTNTKKTKEQFIKQCNEKHGDKYDYSKVEYINNKTKVKIICPIHGEFEMTPNNHLNNNQKCNKCYKKFDIYELTCNLCGVTKDINEFRKGRRSCRLCLNKTQSEYRKNNSDKVKSLRKKWRLKNKHKENERTKKWRDSLTDEQKSQQRNKRNEYLKNKRKVDPNFKMKEAMHRMLLRTLNYKTDKSSKLLGYTKHELKSHIESLFTEGMTWDNYGEWHIDHIKPINSFEENTPPNVINALNNLQPLWATTREINGIIYQGNLNKGIN